MKRNVTTILQQKKQLQKTVWKHVIKQRKQNAMYNSVMRVVFLFCFFNALNSPTHRQW